MNTTAKSDSKYKYIGTRPVRQDGLDLWGELGHGAPPRCRRASQ